MFHTKENMYLFKPSVFYVHVDAGGAHAGGSVEAGALIIFVQNGTLLTFL